MADSTKPSSGGEEGNIFRLPLAKQHGENGKQELVSSPGPIDKKTSEATGDVVAAISGMQDETAEQVGGEIGELVKIDFKKGRKRGLASSHTAPHRAKPGLRSVKQKSRPKALKVDGLTTLPSPMVDKIVGGKRQKVSEASIRHKDAYAKRTGRQRLMQVAGIREIELSEMEEKELSAADFNNTAHELLALGREDFAQEKRTTDNRFFNEVSNILLKLWPKNYQLYLDDKRITSMMKQIHDGEPKAKILSLLVTWHQYRIS